MGKTLQTISLMLTHKEKCRTPAAQLLEVERGLKLNGGGNLVIVPVIALAQWRTELLKWTAPGELTIFTYHGPKRDVSSWVLNPLLAPFHQAFIPVAPLPCNSDTAGKAV